MINTISIQKPVGLTRLSRACGLARGFRRVLERQIRVGCVGPRRLRLPLEVGGCQRGHGEINNLWDICIKTCRPSQTDLRVVGEAK